MTGKWRPHRGRSLGALSGVLVTGILIAAGCGSASSEGATTAATTATTVDLATAPWLHQPDGSPSINAVAPLPSARFAPGVDYAEALRIIYDSGRTGSPLPADVTLAAPLPAEVVRLDEGDRVRVSLTAPFGWTADTRVIRPASIAIPGSIPLDEARQIADRLRDPASPLPAAVRVDVPQLDPCQVAVDTPQGRPSCD